MNDLGAMALDYRGERGIATSIGHAPVAALANPACGSRLAIAEALTNLVWAPIEQGIKGVSCQQTGCGLVKMPVKMPVYIKPYKLPVILPSSWESISRREKTLFP